MKDPFLSLFVEYKPYPAPGMVDLRLSRPSIVVRVPSMLATRTFWALCPLWERDSVQQGRRYEDQAQSKIKYPHRCSPLLPQGFVERAGYSKRSSLQRGKCKLIDYCETKPLFRFSALNTVSGAVADCVLVTRSLLLQREWYTIFPFLVQAGQYCICFRGLDEFRINFFL